MGSQHAVGGFSSPLHIHALRTLIQEGTHMTNLKLSRHQFLHLTAGAAALTAVSRIARAQAYPTRPVRIIVPFAPGGSTDIVTRLVAQRLSERLGQQFIVENRPGGGSNIGTEAAVNAPADGYTLVMLSNANAINASLYQKLNFNLIRDSAPVAGISTQASVMVVHPSLPINSVPEFIAYAKANPGRINMASAGIGSGTHMTGELFKMMAGVDLVHVPYRGEGPAIADLLSGQVQFMFSGVPTCIEYIKAGRVRALGVSTPSRWKTLPDIPAIAEFVPGYEVTAWFALGAPRNTPAEIIHKLNSEIDVALADNRLKNRFADLGAVPMPMAPEKVGQWLADEVEKWAKVVKFSGAKPE
jgi:tripartite-type tricarboxylate transporter receptor subunit TctC